MTNVFLLTSDPGPARAAALGLPRDRFRVVVGVLGPVSDELRVAGVEVHSVPIRSPFDLTGVRRLRRVVREADPAVIHAIGPTAARATRLLVSTRSDGGNTPRLVVSGVVEPGGGVGGWLAARQVRRADRVVAETWAEGERYRRLEVGTERLTRIPPCAPPPASEPDRPAVLASLGLPPGARFVATGAGTGRGVGPRDALVAFDMLRQDARDLHLVVFGAGTAAPGLEQLARALAFDDQRVRFAAAADRAAAVRLADAVWVTAPQAGIDEAIEAMAAGKPVVGWATQELCEVVEDGVTGLLAPTGDRAGLAAKARVLIDDPAAGERLGTAGRKRAAEHFSAARTVEQLARVYAELGG